MQERAGVGSTVVIKGELTAHEDVVIAGRVEGLIDVTGHHVVWKRAPTLPATSRLPGSSSAAPSRAG